MGAYRDLFGREKDRIAMDVLKDTIKETWDREQIFSPSNIIQGSENLREALQSRGWPTVNTMAGAAMFQINIYGTAVAMRDVTDNKFFWVRNPCDTPDSDINCVYSENDPVGKDVVRRAAAWTDGGTLCQMGLSDAEIAEGDRRLEVWRVRLLNALQVYCLLMNGTAQQLEALLTEPMQHQRHPTRHQTLTLPQRGELTQTKSLSTWKKNRNNRNA